MNTNQITTSSATTGSAEQGSRGYAIAIRVDASSLTTLSQANIQSYIDELKKLITSECAKKNLNSIEKTKDSEDFIKTIVNWIDKILIQESYQDIATAAVEILYCFELKSDPVDSQTKEQLYKVLFEIAVQSDILEKALVNGLIPLDLKILNNNNKNGIDLIFNSVTYCIKEQSANDLEIALNRLTNIIDFIFPKLTSLDNDEIRHSVSSFRTALETKHPTQGALIGNKIANLEKTLYPKGDFKRQEENNKEEYDPSFSQLKEKKMEAEKQKNEANQIKHSVLVELFNLNPEDITTDQREKVLSYIQDASPQEIKDIVSI